MDFPTPTHIKCNVGSCGKIFTSAFNFQQHYRMHQEYFQFFCEHCGKGFVNRNHLTTHARTHSKSQPYACDNYKKSFISNSNLTRHKKTCAVMTCENQCVLCGKYFQTPASLKRHLVWVHKSEAPNKMHTDTSNN